MSLLLAQNEPARLAVLRGLAILDTPPEQPYDDVAALAGAVCRTPIAMVNFIDGERRWSKASVGIVRGQAPRQSSFCGRTIVAQHGTLIISDSLADPGSFGEPERVDGVPLRFYAGVSITCGDGHALGTVCVADFRSRRVDPVMLSALRVLARQVGSLLAPRARTRQAPPRQAPPRQAPPRLAAAGAPSAMEDPLTSLASRPLLMDGLSRALHRCRRSGDHVGALFCELEGLSAIGDQLGHRARDEALRVVAERLVLSARAADLVGRLAGERFIVVCPDLSEASDIDIVVGRVCDAVARPVTLAGVQTALSLSVGAALAEEGDGAEDVIRRAGAAMYRGKRARRPVEDHARVATA